MMANKKFEKEAAYRNRLAILLALLAHLFVLGAIVYQSDIQGLIYKIGGQDKVEKNRIQP